MAKLPAPFNYRGSWRSQVTLKNGARPHKDFEKHADAKQWIADQLANQNADKEPELGGPKAATLAQALFRYAGMYTIVKGGRSAEMDRINHYLQAAGMKAQRFVTTDNKLVMEEKPVKALPSAFLAHKEARLQRRAQTYKMMASLANRRVSTLTTADFRKFMVCMKTEGLSDSSIQKEIALLKHLFNVAADEWSWTGFENPCMGLKLKGSNVRFVVITTAQKHALRAALTECDNPYFWPMVEIVMENVLTREHTCFCIPLQDLDDPVFVAANPLGLDAQDVTPEFQHFCQLFSYGVGVLQVLRLVSNGDGPKSRAMSCHKSATT